MDPLAAAGDPQHRGHEASNQQSGGQPVGGVEPNDPDECEQLTAQLRLHNKPTPFEERPRRASGLLGATCPERLTRHVSGRLQWL